MSGLRSFVTGADACVPDDGAGPSNAAAAFADALLGRSKQKQQLHELPGLETAGPPTGPAPYKPPSAAQAADAALNADLPAIPGLMNPNMAGEVPFLDEFEAFVRAQGGEGHARDLAGQSVDALAHEFEATLGRGRYMAPAFERLRSSDVHADALTPSLMAFLKGDLLGSDVPHSADASLSLRPLDVELTVPEKCKLRDRSTILARQVFADRGSDFADFHVERLLHSLQIDPQALPMSIQDGFGLATTWDEIYKAGTAGRAMPSSTALNHAIESGGAAAARRDRYKAASRQGESWAEDFAKAAEKNHASMDAKWAEEFTTQKGDVDTAARDAWVEEFQSVAAAGAAARMGAEESTDALEQTRRLAETLQSDKNPKFQNSKFLQFLSKMSRGELIMEGNEVKEVDPMAAMWAEEFAKQRTEGPDAWAREFSSSSWPSNQAHSQTEHGAVSAWAEEFSERTGNLADEWVQQFEEGRGTIAAAAWEEEYLAELERLNGVDGPQSSAGYRMSADNPFLNDLNSLEKGKELFKRGVLSEAILALEAECQRHPENAEAWRLLGTVQAEADDDIQAIAALNRAVAVDPDNLDALLSLGVSYTNELEQRAALRYLWEWLRKHPVHSNTAKAALEQYPGDSSQELSSILRAFETAATSTPRDKDVHEALGVLYNLARRYEDAVAAFRAALALQSNDYSLWNKLGATLANSGRSGEAISAYQEALSLKPNYMRAWTNMGISYANLGEYIVSASNYVRALALNRSASMVWGYLRTSLACAERSDLLSLAEQEDLDALLKAIPDPVHAQ